MTDEEKMADAASTKKTAAQPEAYCSTPGCPMSAGHGGPCDPTPMGSSGTPDADADEGLTERQIRILLWFSGTTLMAIGTVVSCIAIGHMFGAARGWMTFGVLLVAAGCVLTGLAGSQS